MIHVEEDSASSGNHWNFPRWSQPATLLWDFSSRPKGSKAISDRLIEQTIIWFDTPLNYPCLGRPCNLVDPRALTRRLLSKAIGRSWTDWARWWVSHLTGVLASMQLVSVPCHPPGATRVHTWVQTVFTVQAMWNFVQTLCNLVQTLCSPLQAPQCKCATARSPGGRCCWPSLWVLLPIMIIQTHKGYGL